MKLEPCQETVTMWCHTHCIVDYIPMQQNTLTWFLFLPWCFTVSFCCFSLLRLITEFARLAFHLQVSDFRIACRGAEDWGLRRHAKTCLISILNRLSETWLRNAWPNRSSHRAHVHCRLTSALVAPWLRGSHVLRCQWKLVITLSLLLNHPHFNDKS